MSHTVLYTLWHYLIITSQMTKKTPIKSDFTIQNEWMSFWFDFKHNRIWICRYIRFHVFFCCSYYKSKRIWIGYCKKKKKKGFWLPVWTKPRWFVQDNNVINSKMWQPWRFLADGTSMNVNWDRMKHVCVNITASPQGAIKVSCHMSNQCKENSHRAKRSWRFECVKERPKPLTFS